MHNPIPYSNFFEILRLYQNLFLRYPGIINHFRLQPIQYIFYFVLRNCYVAVILNNAAGFRAGSRNRAGNHPRTGSEQLGLVFVPGPGIISNMTQGLKTPHCQDELIVKINYNIQKEKAQTLGFHYNLLHSNGVVFSY